MAEAVRFRSSSDGQSAAAGWLFWSSAGDAVDDLPEARDYNPSVRSAPPRPAQTGARRRILQAVRSCSWTCAPAAWSRLPRASVAPGEASATFSRGDHQGLIGRTDVDRDAGEVLVAPERAGAVGEQACQDDRRGHCSAARRKAVVPRCFGVAARTWPRVPEPRPVPSASGCAARPLTAWESVAGYGFAVRDSS